MNYILLYSWVNKFYTLSINSTLRTVHLKVLKTQIVSFISSCVVEVQVQINDDVLLYISVIFNEECIRKVSPVFKLRLRLVNIKLVGIGF